MKYRKNIRLQSRIQRQRRTRISLLSLGVVLLIVMGLIGITSGATPPQDAVDRAHRAAIRAAATQSSIQSLRDQSVTATHDIAASQALAVLEAASVFSTLEFQAVPENWVEAGLDLSKATREGDKLVQVLPNGGKVTFTIEPDTQQYLENMMRNNQVPHGSVVLMDPPTGRILAMASHDQHKPLSPLLAQKAMAPSASVFKIVTAAALMESADFPHDKQVCYHGGTRSLTARNIRGDARLDTRCNDLGGALVWSINSIMAKLTYNKLTREDLEVWAERFGYNTEIPFEFPLEVSRAEVVEDPLERARLAAGFWHTFLTPVHGAMIGASLANDGVMMRPSVIESYESPRGDILYNFEPKVFRRVMAPETANKIGELMVDTARSGTARRYFGHRRDFPRAVEVSGKTGTLSNQNPFLRFTWFVGYAQHDVFGERGVAVGSLMANTEKWRILGPQAASNALKKHYEVARLRYSQQKEVASR